MIIISHNVEFLWVKELFLSVLCQQFDILQLLYGLYCCSRCRKFKWMHPVTLTVSASFYYTSGNREKHFFFTSSLATDDKQRWMKRLQWSLPHRGRQAERGAQADFSSCSFYLTYFFNHKVTFEVQQDAYRKHSPKKNLKARDYKDP